MILVPPVVVALASVIPTAITYLSVRLIMLGVSKGRQRAQDAQAPSHTANHAKQ